MSIILHIGMPKTGSTFLQDWLRLNRGVLARSGLAALNNSLAHRVGIEAITDAATLERRDVREIRQARSWEHAITRLRAEPGRCVVSSEYMAISDPKFLAAKLSSHGLKVSAIVAYLRRQDRLCASGYAQEVKSLGLSTIPSDVSYTPVLDWNLQYASWAEAFPSAEMTFLNYERHCADDTLAASFKTALGVGHVRTSEPRSRANISLSAEMTEVARLLNDRGSAFSLESLLVLQRRYPGAPFCFSQQLISHFEAVFRPSNEMFAQRFPHEFSEFAAPGWKPSGVDMTGRVSAERLAELMPHIRRADSLVNSVVAAARRVASLAKQHLEDATAAPFAPRVLDQSRAPTDRQ